MSNKKMDMIREIANYINDNWNGTKICITNFEATLHDVIEEFYYEKLKWCGCGDPSVAMKAIKDYLEAVQTSNFEERRKKLKSFFGVSTVYDNGLLLCLAYSLDEAGITEHGSSIGGAWITKEGEMFLWCLQHIENFDEFEL